METPPKKLRKEDSDMENVFGYVQQVSPLKLSAKNNSYFNMTLQTSKDEFHNAVCFAAEKHPAMVAATAANHPVKITCLQRVPSYTNAATYDYKCTKRSLVETLKHPCDDVKFKRKSPPAVKFCTIQAIKDGQCEQNTASVCCKIVRGDSGVPTETKDGRVLKLTTYVAADSSGSMRVSVWESSVKTLVTGQCYRIKNAKRSIYQDEVYLTLNKSTEVDTTDDIGDVREPPAQTKRVMEGAIVSVNTSLMRLCIRCAAQVESSHTMKIQKCPACGMSQKQEALRKRFTLELMLEDDNVYKIESQSLIDSFTGMGKSQLLEDEDDVTAFLLCRVKSVHGYITGKNTVQNLHFVLDDESPTVADESQAVVDESPAVADESPAVASSPALADESPAVADQSPALADESPAVADESPAVADESPAVADESPALADEDMVTKL